MTTFNRSTSLPLAFALASLIGSTTDVTAVPFISNSHAVNSYTIAQSTYSPIGNYTAQTNGTVGTGRLRNRRFNATATPGSNQTLTISINSFSSSSEIQTIRAAGIGNFSSTISSYRHGTVFYQGNSYPINLATYRTEDNGYYFLQLVSATPFSKSASQTTISANGNTVATIELRVPKAGGAGEGRLYQSSQVSLSKSGAISNQGGVSTATFLKNVIKTQ